MAKNWHIPRRTFLKGLGTAMALPLLEAMEPVRALSAVAKGASVPRRMAFLYIPNGALMRKWTPSQTGTEFELPYILEPLNPVKKDILILTGLAHDKARPNGDGPGDHARASATFLTAAQARKTSGADIRVGISVDQVAAQKIGHLTRLPSLELGCDEGKLAGNCDSGYSCAYSSNISWRNDSTPMAKEIDPRLVFERLFSSGTPGETAESRARRQRYQKSILDFVLDDARKLQSNLGTTDRRKLDEYLTAVREMELRIERADKVAQTLPNYQKPTGIPQEYADHIRLMMDLMVLAFQSDVTRISSFALADDGSNRNYPFLGIPEQHHYLSHYGRNEEWKEKISKINRFHAEQFAYFLQRLKSIPEGNGTLLDNSMIVYGSGISDGDRHNHDDLPAIVAGGGGGTITTGRHLKFTRDIPMANLFVSLLERVDVQVERFGDSTGKLQGLS